MLIGRLTSMQALHTPRITSRSLSSVMKTAAHCFGMAALAIALGVLSGCERGTSAVEEVQAAGKSMQAGDLPTAIIHLKKALQKDPKLVQARRTLGQAYLIAGLGANAEKEYRHVVESDQVTPGDKLSLSRALIQQHKFKEAIKSLPEKAAGVDALILKGDAYRGLEDDQRAASLYAEAVAEQPSAAAGAYKGLAWLAWRRGDTANMAEDISKALEQSPRDVEAWLMKGQVAAYKKQTGQALDAYTSALKVSHYGWSRFVLETHSSAAQLLLNQRQPDKAKPHIEAIGSINPQAPLYKFLDARYNYQKGDLTTAFTELRDVLKRFPKHPRSLVLLGALERERGNLDQAKEYLVRALSVRPDNLYARQLLGLVHLALQQYPEAIKLLESVVRVAPDDAYTWAELGSAYIKIGDLDGATRALTRASELGPSSVEVRNLLAVNYLVSGKNDSALKELRKVVQDEPGNNRANYLMIVTQIRTGDFQAAIAAAEKLRKEQPDNAVSVNLLGVAYNGLGDAEKAARLFKQAIKLNPKYISAAINLIKLDLNTGRLKEAKAGFERILIQKPNSPVALVGLAKILLTQGRRDEAIDRLQQARAQNPQDLQSRLLLSTIYRQQGGSTRALVAVQEALAIKPDAPRALLLASYVQLQLGQLDAARASTAKLLKLHPDLEPALYQQALIKIRGGRLQEGFDDLQQLLRKYPSNAGAKIALSNLELRMGTQPGKRRALPAADGVAQSKSLVDSMIQIRNLVAGRKFDEALGIAKAAVKNRPDSINALVILAGVYRAKNEPVLAKKTFEKIFTLDPNSDIAELNLASLALLKGNTQAARQHYSKVLERDGNDVTALIGLAALADDSRALEYLQQAHKAHPDALQPVLLLAQLHLKQRRWRQAFDVASAGLQRAPANLTLLQSAATAALVLGDFASAERRADQLLKQAPNSSQAWQIKGQIRIAQKSFDQGREYLQKAQKSEPDNPRIKIMLANLEYNAGRYAKARDLLRKVTAKQPKLAPAWILLGDAYWRLKNTQAAITSYSRANQALPSTTTVIKLARARFQTQDKAQAKALLSSWLQSKPDDTSVREVLGDFYMAEQNWPAASGEYELILKSPAANPVVMNKLASAYTRQGDKRSENILEAAYRLDDQNPDILDAYGWMLVGQNQLQQGIQVLRKAAGLLNDPGAAADRATTLYHLAEAYRKSGDKKAARRELEASLALQVEFPEKDLAELTLLRLQ